MVWIILIIVVVLIIAWAFATYNKLVDLRNRVKDQWAQIDVQLKRRFDLIPNLVETVKGYAKHESETLEAVIQARNTYVSATTPEAQMKADGELEKAISKLFALSESYPELKANESYQSLMKELTKIEDDIENARKYYNATVRMYNDQVEMFPSNILAAIFGYKCKEMFEADEKERENVKVKL